MPRVIPRLARPAFQLRALAHPLVCLGLALLGQQILASGGGWGGGLILLGAALLFAVSVGVEQTLPDQVRHAESAADAAPPQWSLADVAAILLVTAVAAAFRLYTPANLELGLAPDEARLGLAAAAPFAGDASDATWGGWPILHWLTVASVAVLGHTPTALRLPFIGAGILYAPALYLVGRQLGGRLLGATAALLGAVTFWHADATRGAWGYIGWGLTLETLAVAMLVWALRYRRPATAAFGGVALGLALQASWGALVVPVAVGCWLVLRSGLSTTATQPFGRAVALPFTVYFLLAVGPVLVGLTVPDRVAAATLGEGAIGDASGSSLPGAVARALLMLNVAGDPSPLHNLSGQPMLDGVTAPLVVLGLALALTRPRRPTSGLLIGWLVAAFVPAVVASRGGGPDSLAGLHLLSPALLLAALALTSLSAKRFPGRTWRNRLHPDLVIGLVVVIAAVNAHTLFVRRTHDIATWTAYASAETMAGQSLRPRVEMSAVYLADTWVDHPTIRFLVPALSNPRTIDPTATIPFLADQALTYFAPGSQDVIADDLERVYDDGNIDRFRSPIDDSIVARSFRASASDVAASRGVTLRVTAGERQRQIRQTLPTYSVVWPMTAGPPGSATLDIFAAVRAPVDGVYRLRLNGPPGAHLELNGAILLYADQEMDVLLARGSQRMRVLANVDVPTRIDLTWAPPGSADLTPIPADHLFREQRAGSGLLAFYRPGTDPDSPISLMQVERHLQRVDSPPRLPRPYTVDWLGIVDAPKSGIYKFAIDASGPASLWIDDRPVMIDVSSRDRTGVALLDEGDHEIRVHFTDAAAPTRFDLLWAPPGEELVAISTSRFSPPPGPPPAQPPRRADRQAGLVPLGETRIRWLTSVDGEPRAVAAAADGTVYVVNTRLRQIQHIGAGGRDLASLSGPGFGTPSDVEVGVDGRIWVLDAERGQVVRFDPDGGNPTIIGQNAALYRPRGLALAADGTVYVADTGGNRIVQLASDGSMLRIIGPEVGGPERLRQPTDVAVSQRGDLYVVNGEEGTVLRLGSDGGYIRHWRVLPSDTERGSHLAVAPDGAIWVSEPNGRRVSRFADDGTAIGVVSQTREARVLRSPVGIAIGADGTLYVADVSLRAVLAIATTPP